MPTVLVIEDEDDLRHGLELSLRREGFDVLGACRGDEGLELALGRHPDLVLLDIMLPGIDGFELCKELRKRDFVAPILILTARESEVDRVVGLEIGADDYVLKPFSLPELIARVRAHLRRSSLLRNGIPTTFRFAEVEVDFGRRLVRRAGEPVHLTPKEFDLLHFLVERAGTPVTRDELLDRIWGYTHFPTTRTVDTHVFALRQKLEANPSVPRHIVSVHGVGYRFEA